MAKIAFSGPSGSGKTTLAKFVAQELGIPFVSSSVDDVLTSMDKAVLKEKYGYESKGHKNVIEMTTKGGKEGFGKEFQSLVRQRRIELFSKLDNYVADRCALDLLAYYLMQNSFMDTTEESAAVVKQCQDFYMQADIVFLVRSVNQGPIEDNGSRITNKYYQKAVESVFETTEYMLRHPKSLVFYIDFWDLEGRKKFVIDHIKRFI